MKAKVFNKVNAASMSARDLTPMLTVNTRAGLISFSQGFVKATKLSGSQRVNFIQDEESPKDWYVQITKDAQAFALRQMEGKGGCISFNSTAIARELTKACGLESGGTYRFLLSTEKDPTADGNFYAVITKSAKEFVLKREKK